jgi:hypothetical protein
LSALALAVLVSAAGCAFGNTAEASFDPSTPCNGAARQQMHGAYPDLEARVPPQLAGSDASNLESGRYCAKETIGSLWDAGFTEVQFGGGIYSVGDTGGIQASVWRAPGLTTQLMADEYRNGAQADRKVTVVSATTEQIAGRNGFRMNLLNGEARQAILVWPSKDGAVVQVVIGSDVDESALQVAVSKLG